MHGKLNKVYFKIIPRGGEVQNSPLIVLGSMECPARLMEPINLPQKLYQWLEVEIVNENDWNHFFMAYGYDKLKDEPKLEPQRQYQVYPLLGEYSANGEKVCCGRFGNSIYYDVYWTLKP